MSSREDASSEWGWGAGAWGWGAIDDNSAGELIERLSAEFARLVNVDTVTAIVQRCRRDLGVTPAPSAETVEQLARQRLYDLTGAYEITGVAGTGWAAGSSAYLLMRLLSGIGDGSGGLPTAETRASDHATSRKRPPRRRQHQST